MLWGHFLKSHLLWWGCISFKLNSAGQPRSEFWHATVRKEQKFSWSARDFGRWDSGQPSFRKRQGNFVTLNTWNWKIHVMLHNYYDCKVEILMNNITNGWDQTDSAEISVHFWKKTSIFVVSISLGCYSLKCLRINFQNFIIGPIKKVR